MMNNLVHGKDIQMIRYLPEQLILASHNQGKLVELQQLFNQANLTIELEKVSSFGICDIEETGLSFVENAILKARHVAAATHLPALADDSGLCVPQLNHQPGIYSARYAGQHGNDDANITKLINQLTKQSHLSIDIKNQENSAAPVILAKAYFVCVLALVRHATDPLPLLAIGQWHGHIIASRRGEYGFGYDPVFYLSEYQQTAAEMTPSIKNTLSHRAIATNRLIKQLKDKQY